MSTRAWAANGLRQVLQLVPIIFSDGAAFFSFFVFFSAYCQIFMAQFVRSYRLSRSFSRVVQGHIKGTIPFVPSNHRGFITYAHGRTEYADHAKFHPLRQ